MAGGGRIKAERLLLLRGCHVNAEDPQGSRSCRTLESRKGDQFFWAVKAAEACLVRDFQNASNVQT